LTDVYEMSSPFRALVNFQNSPVESGFSVGINSDPRAGTVGAVVAFGTTRYILSNAHVLRGTPNSTKIAYPAIEDSPNQPTNIVGVLRHRVPLATRENRADAALAEINSGVEIDPTIPGATPPYSVGTAAKDMKVIGTGRTTGTIRGVIRVTDFDGEVDVAGATLDFEDQVACTGFANDGDSGTLIMEESTGQILGLLFAASDTEFLFTPVAAVRDVLGVNFRFVNPGE